MKKSRQQKKEDKQRKRSEAEDKIKNLTKTQKWVGVGIISVLIVSVFSCQPSDEDLAKSQADKAINQQLEAEAEEKKPKELGISSTDGKTACNEKIKEETKQFSKVKVHFLTDAVFIKDASGKANASIGFTVTNNYGVDKRYVGYCYFDEDESMRTFEIQEGAR